jgi:hypothetical protein
MHWLPCGSSVWLARIQERERERERERSLFVFVWVETSGVSAFCCPKRPEPVGDGLVPEGRVCACEACTSATSPCIDAVSGPVSMHVVFQLCDQLKKRSTINPSTYWQVSCFPDYRRPTTLVYCTPRTNSLRNCWLLGIDPDLQRNTKGIRLYLL